MHHASQNPPALCYYAFSQFQGVCYPHHTITSKLRAYTIHWDQPFWTVRLFSSEAKDAFSTIGEGPEGFFPLFGAPIGGEGLVEGGIYWRGASIGGGHLLNWRGASIGRGRLSEGSVY